MKHNSILLCAASAMVLLGSASCSDLLDIPQHGVLNYDTYYNTDEQIESASAAMYLEVRGWEYNVMLTKNMLTDDFTAGGAQRGDNIDLERLNEFTFDAEESYIENMFTTYYTLIYKANVVLGHVDESMSEMARMACAEAKTLRAWAYFDLITMWGNPPLVDHELLPSEYSMPNASKEQLWAFVEKDLTEAIESGALAEKSSVSDNTTWRVTKQFAQAVLGKAYLWQGKYEEAAKQFNAVVESEKYKLFDGEYGDMHRVSNKHNCESIFESNRIHDDNNQYQNFTMYYIMINWRMDKLDYPGDTPLMNTGFGFRVPADDLYREFVRIEGADGYRLNQTLKTYEQIKDQLGMSVKPGSTVLNEGYFMWKDRALSEDRGFSNDYFYNGNPLWMRYAEVLLCGAEASLLAGDAATATDYVNQVRARARLAPLSTVTLDDIKVEKRLELCGEGQRFQDLVRWGEAASRLADNGKTYPVLSANGNVEYVATNNASAGFKAGKNEVLPYPATEKRLNDNIVQNIGY